MKTKTQLFRELVTELEKYTIAKTGYDDQGELCIYTDLTHVPELPHIIEIFDITCSIRHGLRLQYRYRNNGEIIYCNTDPKLLIHLLELN